MAKRLHQHIAVEDEVKNTAEKIKQETLKGFREGHLYNGIAESYSPNEDNGEKLPPVNKEVVTTVPVRLDYTKDPIIDLLDYELTRDAGNQIAKANLVVDGKVIASDVPATTLLSLEKRLRDIRAVYEAIPTLDLSQKWEVLEKTPGMYKFGPESVYRTAKKTSALTLAAATDKHPAQVKEVVHDVQIGVWAKTKFSGALHPGDKSKLLKRIDSLIKAAKVARMEANSIEVTDKKIGAALFSFIHASE